MDAERGTPLAVLEAGHLTAVRTGAPRRRRHGRPARRTPGWPPSSAPASRAGRSSEAIAAVRPLRKAFVVDTDRLAAAAFAEDGTRACPRRRASGLSFGPPRGRHRFDGDDVGGSPCSATGTSRPASINAVGSYKPHVREIPGETIRRAALFVDDRRASLEEAGDIIIPLRQGIIDETHIRAEIGEVLAGLKPGRRSEDEITVFKSVGNAVEDLAVAALVLG